MIFQVPYIALCWRTEVAHDSGSQQIVLESSYGIEYIHIGDTLGFGFADGIFERIVVTGKVDSTITFHYPLMINHPAGHMLFEWSFTLPGFTPKAYNLSIIRDYTDTTQVIHNIRHEFMHQFLNGALGHTSDTDNLMYPSMGYRGNKLRYRTIKDSILQWVDVHN